MGADRVEVREAYEQLKESALTGSRLSSSTRAVLHRYDMEDAFEDDPDDALARLHQIACDDDRRDIRFALAELNYLRARTLRRSFWRKRRRRARDHYLASSVYAWLFLLGEGTERTALLFDRQAQMAAEIYSRGLGQGLVAADARDGKLDLSPGTRHLPAGPVKIEFSLKSPWLDPTKQDGFYLADQYVVRGLTVRNRTAGVGAPLIAVGKAGESVHRARLMPATAFLRMSGDIRSWKDDGIQATLELYSPFHTTELTVQGYTVPVASDTTTPIAYALNNEFLWKLGWNQFFSAKPLVPTGLYAMQPYEPGKLHVIFVHGTLSSPVWWAEMWNTLYADPVVRERYQFWNFIYNSGQPVVRSVIQLREAITKEVAALDPEGKDPGLQRIVVIGHSQGGMLTRMTASDIGDRLWRMVSEKSLDELKISEERREKLRKTLFYPPLPCVKRLVFISTPHRGSYLAGSFVRSLGRWLISVPGTVFGASVNAVKYPFLNEDERIVLSIPKTSLGSMSPRNKYLYAIAEAPFAPGVKAHSIIAIKGKAQPPKGSDGVVKYTSAHLGNVESELIVRSGHSCQGKPRTIEEVRRILFEHLATAPKPEP
jgi:pimeloyl-ACP methyl ester carboxylesterase